MSLCISVKKKLFIVFCLFVFLNKSPPGSSCIQPIVVTLNLTINLFLRSVRLINLRLHFLLWPHPALDFSLSDLIQCSNIWSCSHSNIKLQIRQIRALSMFKFAHYSEESSLHKAVKCFPAINNNSYWRTILHIQHTNMGFWSSHQSESQKSNLPWYHQSVSLSWVKVIKMVKQSLMWFMRLDVSLKMQMQTDIFNKLKYVRKGTDGWKGWQ